MIRTKRDAEMRLMRSMARKTRNEGRERTESKAISRMRMVWPCYDITLVRR
jgi:hypothetical protein